MSKKEAMYCSSAGPSSIGKAGCEAESSCFPPKLAVTVALPITQMETCMQKGKKIDREITHKGALTPACVQTSTVVCIALNTLRQHACITHVRTSNTRTCEHTHTHAHTHTYTHTWTHARTKRKNMHVRG